MYDVAHSTLNNIGNAVHNAFLTIADNFEKLRLFLVMKSKLILLL